MKYKKDLTSILPINQNLMVKILKDEIIIENFNNILDINELEIRIDNYIIKGNFLKIVSMENRSMIISGKIQEILVL